MEHSVTARSPRHAAAREHAPRSALVALAAALVALHVWRPDGGFGDLTYQVALIGAGVIAVIGALRRPRATRVPWCWVAGGVCLSALGDLSYFLYVQLRGFEPNVSIADVPWLASYVAISIGMVMLLRSTRRGDGSDVDGLIDMAVVAVVSLLIMWQVSVSATISDTSVSSDVRAIWASYPILDAALLALVVRTAITRVPGALLLVAGVSCWLFADFFYMLFPTSTSWAVWLDAGWMLGASLLAAATWLRVTDPRARRKERVGRGRLALTIAPLLVPGIIEVVAYSRGVEPNPVPLLAASVVLAVLAFVRALRLLQNTQRARADLFVAEQHFEALVQRSSDAAIVLEADGRVRYVSPAARDQFGYQVEDLLGRLGWDLIHPDDLARAMQTFGSIMDVPGAHASAELRIRDADGDWRWVEAVVTNLIDEPAVAGVVANIRDISVRKAAEEQLSRLAHYDALTGLPNRWLLTQNLDEALAGDSPAIALLIIDLDQFKFVNDSRGHAVGDQLLVAVSESLRPALPPGDTIGRIGGDEFGVLCRDVDDIRTARARALAVEFALADPIELKDTGVIPVAASIGIALGGPDMTSEGLLQQADTAMYEAKRLGAGQSVTFDDDLRHRADELLTVQTDLRSALRAGELIVHYQPVVDLATGRMDSVEALVRWRHPTRGLVMPGDFIPIAEHSDLIDRIGAFVLDQACSDAAWWGRTGHPISVAVNISAAQLRHEGLAATIRNALYDCQLGAEFLTLEITETALMRGAERAMENVRDIRALGVHVALDDFGTGYSSLSYLKRVPADIVKIDRSFVTDIVENEADRDIAGAIIDLARALGRSVVAEGVETEGQCAVLRRLGCPLAQGWLWAKAVPAEQVPALRETFAETATRLRIITS